MSCEVFQTLKNNLKADGFSTNIGDEGGFAPALESTERALDAVVKAIRSCGYILEKDFYLALDCASTEYFENHRYNLAGENKSLSADENTANLKRLCDMYPIFSIVSLNVPIWFGFIRIAFPAPLSIPSLSRILLVTNKSSPTNCTFGLRVLVSSFQPSQSSSAIPSSIEKIG